MKKNHNGTLTNRINSNSKSTNSNSKSTKGIHIKDYEDMKSNDEYIVKIRNLCSEQGLFSLEELSVLTTVFESLSGKPPVVHTDRFRADNHQWLSLLDQFENPHQFLKRIGDGKFYALSSYALPLVEVARAMRLLGIMEKIYQNLKELYHDYLAESVEVEILIDGIDGYDQRGGPIYLNNFFHFLSGSTAPVMLPPAKAAS